MKWDPSLPRPVSHDARLGGVQVAFRINYEAGRAKSKAIISLITLNMFPFTFNHPPSLAAVGLISVELQDGARHHSQVESVGGAVLSLGCLTKSMNYAPLSVY